MPGYTSAHARAGIDAGLPKIETWPNQFPGYQITVRVPEYTSICPKTGLPDYGAITIQYEPRKRCLELKALRCISWHTAIWASFTKTQSTESCATSWLPWSPRGAASPETSRREAG